MRRAFILNDVAYDLSHLNPYVRHYEYLDKKTNLLRKFVIAVAFGSHCYTVKEPPEGSDKRSLLVTPLDHTRYFDEERYHCSKQVSEIIEQVIRGYCYRTGKGNYLVIKVMDDSGKSHNYEVYFTLSRINAKTCRLFVQSAYIRDRNHDKNKIRDKKIMFSTLITNIMDGKPVSKR